MISTLPVQLLRPRQAAEFLGVGVATSWRWAKARPDMPKARKFSARCIAFDRHKFMPWRNAQGQRVAA